MHGWSLTMSSTTAVARASILCLNYDSAQTETFGVASICRLHGQFWKPHFCNHTESLGYPIHDGCSRLMSSWCPSRKLSKPYRLHDLPHRLSIGWSGRHPLLCYGWNRGRWGYRHGYWQADQQQNCLQNNKNGQILWLKKCKTIEQSDAKWPCVSLISLFWIRYL